ncbi:MAG: ABC transporter permease [Gulosibacter sp.]|uniref:ABC transporter permease n=1 Tax=Gulosibacter sp. TaxID=2817531 RepID=UPI003F900E90
MTAPTRALFRQPGVTISLLFLVWVAIAAVWPQWLSDVDPTSVDPDSLLQPPSTAALFGTDELGRDVYSRVVQGASLTVQAAFLAIVIAAAFGLFIGVVAGAAGGILDTALMRIVDVKLAVPGLLLALVIISALEFNAVNAAIAVGIGFIPSFARTTRARVLTVRSAGYVEAARTSGHSRTSILFKHILPNASGPVAALFVLDFGGAIIAVATLNFLGFGAQPPLADWGSLISDGRNFLTTAPWVPLLPGLVVVCTVLALNHLARSLEEVSR